MHWSLNIAFREDESRVLAVVALGAEVVPMIVVVGNGAAAIVQAARPA